MVNYIRFVWNLTCILRTYTTYNPTVGFAKYEFNNKLLDGVTFFRVTMNIIHLWVNFFLSLFDFFVIKKNIITSNYNRGKLLSFTF